MKPLTLGHKRVGPGCPTFVIAEIGYNYNTLAQARDTVDAAMECGADAVKLQSFRAETVTSRHTDFPQEAGATNQFEEFQRYELSEEGHHELFEYARRRGVLLFSTPSHSDDVALLEKLDVPAYKLGSDDLTNLPFLEHVARLKKPMIISTGMASLAEVAEAYECIQATGQEQLAILHCLSNYPIQDVRHLNLRAVEVLRAAFDVPIGYSDHTQGAVAALGAVALGACIIEKHFVLDQKLDTPDAFFSADPAELKALIGDIRQLEAALGEPVKRPAPSELKMRHETRKSVVARVAIPAGAPIRSEMLIIKRPGHGIAPKHAHLVPGRRARTALQADEVITWEKLD